MIFDKDYARMAAELDDGASDTPEAEAPKRRGRPPGSGKASTPPATPPASPDPDATDGGDGAGDGGGEDDGSK